MIHLLCENYPGDHLFVIDLVGYFLAADLNGRMDSFRLFYFSRTEGILDRKM